MKRLERGLHPQQLVTSDLPQLRKDLNQRPKKLEDSHSDLQEAKRVLHKRISTIKADLEKKVKVDVEEQVKSEIWEGILRHRRLPGKEWSKAEIERGRILSAVAVELQNVRPTKLRNLKVAKMGL
ncbi:uncharacterized protein N7479_003987 [Penicillium vulpinum]|uniref:uncharacterized protein n=1 Tax=Penicillium vulpinum TaxID=29845 RepID=UPI0025476730|nr:uncharacterized protein N7479_003987 [Penicillium vulpinum]KAJ5964111.1 hypothetical protein N7479_003987 [Penicillium vulpinum]